MLHDVPLTAYWGCFFLGRMWLFLCCSDRVQNPLTFRCLSVNIPAEQAKREAAGECAAGHSGAIALEDAVALIARLALLLLLSHVFKAAAVQRQKKSRVNSHSSEKEVGQAGFEPTTPCTPCKCATRLRYCPRKKVDSAAQYKLRRRGCQYIFFQAE